MQVFRIFLCVALVTIVLASPMRQARNADTIDVGGEDTASNSIEPTKDNPKQDLVGAETLWGPGPWGPPPPWAWGPGPFGPFGPGPFGPFGPGPFGPSGPFGPGPFGPGFGPFG